MILGHYADSPGAVARAIEALRAGIKHVRWLTRTLEGSPELSGLAAAVRAELHGV